MKRKVIMGSIAGLLVLGGAMGVGAFFDRGNEGSEAEMNGFTKEETDENVENIYLEEKMKDVHYDAGNQTNKDDDRDEQDDWDDDDRDDNWGDINHDDDYECDGDSEDDRDDSLNDTQKSRTKISKQKAIAIATKATSGKVVEAEFDDDHYEIEIKTGKTEIEYEIDAYTGKILDKEVDRDDDDDKNDDE